MDFFTTTVFLNDHVNRKARSMNTAQAHVTKSDSDFVTVKTFDAKTKEDLLNLGFSDDINRNEYRIHTQSDEIKAGVFKQLRDLGVYFSGGREWCPAEVFMYLRDKKLLSGKFAMIRWTSPDNYFITTDQ